MKDPEHISDEQLIEFHLDESEDAASIREHVGGCVRCAKASESIAKTLRFFSSDPVPQKDLDRQWRRLRSVLPVGPVGQRKKQQWFRWPLLVPGLAGATMILILAMRYQQRVELPKHSRSNGFGRSEAVTTVRATPGASQIEQQLDGAERLLTIVNHASGPLQATTREQAHSLLVRNASCIRVAHAESNFANEVVLDNLGRVLVDIDHAGSSSKSGLNMRLEWDTKGLLLDIRILRQDASRYSTAFEKDKS